MRLKVAVYPSAMTKKKLFPGIFTIEIYVKNLRTSLILVDRVEIQVNMHHYYDKATENYMRQANISKF